MRLQIIGVNGFVALWSSRMECSCHMPAVSDTSANGQQAGHLLDTYSCSLFTDPLHIQLHIETWEVGPKKII